MKSITGKLRYLTWEEPWMVGDVNVRPEFMSVITSLEGSTTSQKLLRDSYSLRADPDSEQVLKQENGGSTILMDHPTRFSLTNVRAYLEDSLTWLNGRKVSVKTGDDFRIESSSVDETQKMYYTHSNSCTIPEGMENSLCGIGNGKETCVFITLGKDGFLCEKFSSTARTLLLRLSEGSLNAGRIGDCQIAGRKAKQL